MTQSFRDPGLENTRRMDTVDFDLAARVLHAGEDRRALLEAMRGSSKREIKIACAWICSDRPQMASVAWAAANVAEAGDAKRAVARFIELRRGQYSGEIVRQVSAFLEGVRGWRDTANVP